MSDVFAKQAALVLCNAGVKAYLFDSLRPVPVLSFTIRHLKCIARHRHHRQPQPQAVQRLQGLLDRRRPDARPSRSRASPTVLPETTYAESVPMDEAKALAKGLLTYIGKDVDDAYIAAVRKLSVNPELAREMGKTLKIVYTPLHGSGNIPVRRIFRNRYT